MATTDAQGHFVIAGMLSGNFKAKVEMPGFTVGTFNLNYNYSKNLDTMTSISDVFNRGLSKNLTVWDIPHQLRLTAQYVVPRIKDVPVLKNKFVSYALSDWGVGAYLNYQSAAALGRPSSNGSTPISQFLGRGPGGAQNGDRRRRTQTWGHSTQQEQCEGLRSRL